MSWGNKVRVISMHPLSWTFQVLSLLRWGGVGGCGGVCIVTCTHRSRGWVGECQDKLVFKPEQRKLRKNSLSCRPPSPPKWTEDSQTLRKNINRVKAIGLARTAPPCQLLSRRRGAPLEKRQIQSTPGSHPPHPHCLPSAPLDWDCWGPSPGPGPTRLTAS